MKKEKIFSKFNTKNFNDELEEVLAIKPFSENVKNNILNMIYKVEEAYDDYKTVKVEVPNEKEFLEKLLKSIREYCNSIEVLTTNEIKEKKYIIDFAKGSIKVSPNNTWMLYAILELLQKNKNYQNESDIIHQKPIYDFLKIGYNINNVEVIREFNGWSWVNSLDEIENINANLIYQNLQILLGNKNMEKLMQNISIKQNNIIEVLQQELEKKYDKKRVQKIVNILNRISIIEISNIDTTYKNILLEIKQRKLEELSLMENKKEYLKEISYIKKTNFEIIKGIDKTINNNELLRLEYKLRNSMLKNDEKIFSISYLVDILNEERKEALEKISEINTLMEPNTYIQKKEEIKNIINEISVNEEILTSSEQEIIEMQKLFIKCFLDEIKFATEKIDIINILYKVRYYINILYSENIYIKDIPEIKDDIQKLKEEIIKKILKHKLVFEFSNDNELNKKILLNILKTRIINLQTIYIILRMNENNIKIEIYDEDELYLIESVVIEDIKKIDVKLDKKIKLFM